MERKKYLVVMAAGHGVRMGSALPKQFIELGGKPILQRTIECFVRAVPDVKVVTVLPKEYMQGWKDLCTRNNFYYPQILIEGGITRFHSVRNALKKVPDGAVVAIQDGVRPLLTPEFAARMFERMDSCRALIPVLPSTDTLKALRRVRDAAGEETLETIPDVVLDRETVFRAQTPQMFLSEELKAAYGQAYDTAFTDDASVASAYGIPLTFCEGERFNIKLTTPEDLELAKAIKLVRKSI